MHWDKTAESLTNDLGTSILKMFGWQFHKDLTLTSIGNGYLSPARTRDRYNREGTRIMGICCAPIRVRGNAIGTSAPTDVVIPCLRSFMTEYQWVHRIEDARFLVMLRTILAI